MWCQRDPSKGLHISAERYFADVDRSTWELTIGGYPVLARWLKQRRGRVLSTAEIAYAERLIQSLTEINRLMDEIDTIPFPFGGTCS